MLEAVFLVVQTRDAGEFGDYPTVRPVCWHETREAAEAHMMEAVDFAALAFRARKNFQDGTGPWPNEMVSRADPGFDPCFDDPGLYQVVEVPHFTRVGEAPPPEWISAD